MTSFTIADIDYPTFLYIPDFIMEQEDEECIICGENLEENRNKVPPDELHCGHVICPDCAKDLILQDPEERGEYPCPLCPEMKKKLSVTDNDYEQVKLSEKVVRQISSDTVFEDDGDSSSCEPSGCMNICEINNLTLKTLDDVEASEAQDAYLCYTDPDAFLESAKVPTSLYSPQSKGLELAIVSPPPGYIQEYMCEEGLESGYASHTTTPPPLPLGSRPFLLNQPNPNHLTAIPSLDQPANHSHTMQSIAKHNNNPQQSFSPNLASGGNFSSPSNPKPTVPLETESSLEANTCATHQGALSLQALPTDPGRSPGSQDAHIYTQNEDHQCDSNITPISPPISDFSPDTAGEVIKLRLAEDTMSVKHEGGLEWTSVKYSITKLQEMCHGVRKHLERSDAECNVDMKLDQWT